MLPTSASERRAIVDAIRLGSYPDPPPADDSSPAALARTFIARYAMRPDLLASEVFGLVLDEFQEEILWDLVAGERQIAVRSGHGVGKSTLLAVAALFYVMLRYRVKVVMTAPTAGQLYDALLAETKSLLKLCPQPIQDLFEVKSDRIEMKGHEQDVFVVAATSSKDRPEALQGKHSDWVLLIADEASGIDDAVFNAAGGSMSGENRTLVMTGNPTRLIGRFAKAFNDRVYRNGWRRYHVGYGVVKHVDSTGCRHYPSSRITDEYAQSVAAEHGTESNEYKIRVLGDFPSADLDSYIPSDTVIAAMQRDITVPMHRKRVWACDVARYGRDATALGEKRGPVVTWVKRKRQLDTMQVAGWILAEYNECPDHDRPVAIFIDVIGIGAGVYDRLREQGLPVHAVNVAESPVDPTSKSMRLRDELYKRVKKWLASMTAKLPEDDDLLADLTRVRYSYSSDGRLKIESKEDMRNRGEQSPDLGDVVAMLMLDDDYAIHTDSDGYRNWNTPLERGLNVTV